MNIVIIIIISIISIISIVALVMACLAFSRTFKNNRERYSDNKQVKIAFQSNQLGRRGTEVSLFDYAYFNEKLLNNKSIIISDKNNGNNDDEVIKKFKKHFPVYLYNDFKEVDEILKKENCDIFYIIKSGENDGKNSKVCKTVVHCVFGCNDPHGDVYSSIAPWVNGNDGKYPVVPHMINLPKHDRNMRNKLNIPKDSIVFGGYGGKGQFDIKTAQDAVYEVAKDNPNIYFVFANFPKFCPQLKNIIHLPKIIDLDKKVEFINTTDAMIHARSDGEVMSLSMGEFSTLNKPIICTNMGYPGHIKLLKDKAVIYTDKDDLKNILSNFKRDDKDWNAYKDYTPEKVMKIFEKVYINDKALTGYEDVALCILTWKKPITLENTLKSYKKFGLLDIIKEKIILCQENDKDEISISEKYNFKVLKSEENIGIGKGMATLANNVKSKYFIFLENDWELISSNFEKEIKNQVINIENKIIDLYRLRHRKNPGEPLCSRVFQGNELKDRKVAEHLLDCVAWVDHPEVKFPGYIKKKNNIYIASCRYAEWTNNPFLCQKKWFIENMSKHFEKSKGAENEIDIQEKKGGIGWWPQQNFNIGQGDGLFTHKDLGK